jgi:hypothetical protein
MKRSGGLIAALFLGACVYGSETPLFDESDAVPLFDDGQVVGWREGPSGDAFDVRFDRNGRGYRLSRIGDLDAPMDLLFVAIHETPADDYIAQLRLGRDGSSGVAYGFMWREGDGYRVLADPRAVDEDGPPPEAARYCREIGSSGECGFDRVADATGYYRAMLYDRFVVGGAEPMSYLDLGAPIGEQAKK